MAGRTAEAALLEETRLLMNGPNEIPPGLRAACERALAAEATIRRDEGPTSTQERRDRLLVCTFDALQAWWRGEVDEEGAVARIEEIVRSSVPPPS